MISSPLAYRTSRSLPWLLVFFMGSISLLVAETPPAPWIPDQGDGTYKNPVLFADYSDPDVVATDGDYYLTASSFCNVPGLPILHSRDLVNWRIVNHALPKLYDDRFGKPQHGNGVWAPSFRYHDGWYYIYWGDPDRGIFMIRSRDPRRAWSEPVLVKQAYGNIDPCPLWDDDGKVYLVHAFAHSRAGVNSLLTVVELSSDGSKVLDKGWIVFDGHAEHPTIEGPKFYKRNGYYYIFAPAGGVPQGWQLVLRSRHVRGPYEVRKVLAQGNTDVNGPHQGGWVTTPAGEDWFLHFQDQGPYGRVVHLEPMQWVDDWPVMGEDPDGDGVGQPVLTHAKPRVSESVEITTPQSSDDFAQPHLGLQWQWSANDDPAWISLTERPGWLRMSAVPRPAEYRNLWQLGNVLTQKFPAPEFRVTAKLDLSRLGADEEFGFVVMGQDHYTLACRRDLREVALQLKQCLKAERGTEEQTLASAACRSAEVEVRLRVRQGAQCEFGYRCGSTPWQVLGPEFSAREGRWIGAKFGFYCSAPQRSTILGVVDVEDCLVGPLP